MAKMIVNDGLRILLGNALDDGNQSNRNLDVAIFIADIPPDGDKELDDYDVSEAAFNGYGRVNANPSGVATVAANVASVVFDIAVFQRTDGVGSEDAYGVFILDPDLDELIGVAEDDAAPVTLDTQGQTYAATLTYKLARG